MPFFNNKVSVFFRQFLCPGKFPDFQSSGFAELNGIFHIENGFTIAFPDVHMNRSVVVAVECEFESIFLEDQRHDGNMLCEVDLARFPWRQMTIGKSVRKREQTANHANEILCSGGLTADADGKSFSTANHANGREMEMQEGPGLAGPAFLPNGKGTD
jgi:hypothetical protein